MNEFFSRLFALFNVVFFYSSCFAHAATLAAYEVEVLRQIAKTLGKTNWDFSVDPCSGLSNWSTPNTDVVYQNAVKCNCSSDTACHVTEIVLKSQNLTGVLPPDLVEFSHLQKIDLSRNYLSGTIPPEWGSMALEHISVQGNRLTGPIPNTFGNITTLKELIVEFNQLSGALPPDLGKLPFIAKLRLTSNNFTGELPASLAMLTTLMDFRIGDNQFTGSIPGFIQNWTNLEKLMIQGSGLSGPIPTGIASLTKLSDLRISDLNGTESTFPLLGNAINLKTLILRSCNIVGTIPENLGRMPNLTTLDLSFNMLSGEIPSSFASPSKIKYIYFTGNLLSGCGSVCDWMLNHGKHIDLSYNNFSSEFQRCQLNNGNLFHSSVKDNRTGIVSCLGISHCPQKWHSLHINCGGREVILNKIKYEEDSEPGGPSNFYRSGTNWACSSTGYFLDDESMNSFILSNPASLPMNASILNMEARGSPLSLTYYAFCLVNGNYTVKLHFAEIVFTDDKTYYSLGRRIFDVYVQGTRVLKNFNIENAAGGVRKEIIKNFTAVVTSGTLEIRFYWAGKGTTSLPYQGVYGPLISAISVNSDTVPPSDGKLSMGVLAGIVAAVVSPIILLLGILWWFCFLRPKYTMKQDLKGLDLQTGSFTLRQIRTATNNFDSANKIGEGGFGSVYKGLLSDGTLIAVKQLSSKSKQGNREFVNEIGMISALQHPHLVKLYGCCIDGNQLLLVYEYMENNSLSRALFGPEECQLNLDWSTRYKICIGIARGLSYLHEESRLKIVHRDIKASNVLLDKDLNPKISDFGLAKLDDEENTHISTRIAGTYGYMAPEYAMHGYLTYKADVYSFGIVALEIVSGRYNASDRTKENSFYILDWAHALKEKGNLMELVDPRLGSDFDREEVLVMINVALLCTDVSLAVRPAMSSVVSMLESRMVHELISEPTVSGTGITLESIEENTNNRQIQSVSIDGPWTASSASASAGNLYPVNLDSAYLAKR